MLEKTLVMPLTPAPEQSRLWPSRSGASPDFGREQTMASLERVYVPPVVKTLSAQQVVELMGPAQANVSGGGGGGGSSDGGPFSPVPTTGGSTFGRR